ncbi:methylthioadenosine phosphorylase [Ammonifex degensii KC4]|uniref:Probable 6-oxopurine nucleoside phosphorylase n=1 Tax=Ammonifex degensii (strain DSM 10501 / KC4) TaxID=429009 RepID=C9RCX1_AMMDK|nr:S-methyl-5'-thioadenosine phosphorylase [Ammonifex degensii]ACX52098.1 methylthioadenosine phosphorylase [Ammonifex degensii KC4]
MPVIAVIGGTGVYDPHLLEDPREEKVVTSYGEVRVFCGKWRGKEVAFLPRHGTAHSVPPHRINYRANIAGLKKLGVRFILATAAVGSLNPQLKPGEFVVVDQFLDFTKRRESTFFDGGPEGVVHVDFTQPYCPELRELLVRAARTLRLPVHDKGTYVCTEGPRFETPAEIKMFQHLGGDLVGMTGVPEVVLAREAEICYAAVALVTNFAAGIAPYRLSHEEVVAMMKSKEEELRKLLLQTVYWIDETRTCSICHQAVTGPVKVKEGEK